MWTPILYSGKFSWDKMFANFANVKQLVKFWFHEIHFQNTAKISDVIVSSQINAICVDSLSGMAAVHSLFTFSAFPLVCASCSHFRHLVQTCSEGGSGGSSWSGWRANHVVPGGSSWGNSGMQPHPQQMPVRNFPQHR